MKHIITAALTALLLAGCGGTQEDLTLFCEGAEEFLLVSIGGGDAAAEDYPALLNPPERYHKLLESLAPYAALDSYGNTDTAAILRDMAAFLEQLAANVPKHTLSLIHI